MRESGVYMIYIGADHGGIELKKKIKEFLSQQKLDFQDCGNEKLDPNDDYPQFASVVAKNVAKDPMSRGILICRSGGGMIIAANKIKQARAVFVFDEKSVLDAREMNDANIISIAADWIEPDEAMRIISLFLTTPFSDEVRHRRRVDQLNSM